MAQCARIVADKSEGGQVLEKGERKASLFVPTMVVLSVPKMVDLRLDILWVVTMVF